MEKTIGERDAAKRLGLSIHTLRSWRVTRHGTQPPRGVPFIRIGKRVLYRESQIEAFVSSCVVSTVAIPTAARPTHGRAGSGAPIP